ncbi:hypothetical protein HY502_00260 [Candidatus Woesebacteria bacterium]|nr:hypothetical protein [Candidatus Woesebacteria bacterium]
MRTEKLLTATERDEITNRTRKLRVSPHSVFDPDQARVMSKWIEKGPLLSEREGEKIAVLFIKNILGLNPKKTNRQEMDERLAEIRAERTGIERFWQEVSKISPHLVGKQDLKYIISRDNTGKVAFQMIQGIVFGPRGHTHSLINRLVNGAPN